MNFSCDCSVSFKLSTMNYNIGRQCHVNGNFLKFICRSLKTAVEENQNKGVKYTSSINLPKTKFPARLTPAQKAETEELIRTVSCLILQRSFN